MQRESVPWSPLRLLILRCGTTASPRVWIGTLGVADLTLCVWGYGDFLWSADSDSTVSVLRSRSPDKLKLLRRHAVQHCLLTEFKYCIAPQIDRIVLHCWRKYITEKYFELITNRTRLQSFNPNSLKRLSNFGTPASRISCPRRQALSVSRPRRADSGAV